MQKYNSSLSLLESLEASFSVLASRSSSTQVASYRGPGNHPYRDVLLHLLVGQSGGGGGGGGGDGGLRVGCQGEVVRDGGLCAGQSLMEVLDVPLLLHLQLLRLATHHILRH